MQAEVGFLLITLTLSDSIDLFNYICHPDFKVIKFMNEVLEKGSKHLFEKAITFLSNLSQIGPDFINLVRNETLLLETLKEMSKEKQSLKTLRLTAWALGNLCNQEISELNSELAEDAIEIFSKLMFVKDEELQFDVSFGLKRMTS